MIKINYLKSGGDAMKETYINFINKNDTTDIFTCSADSNAEIIRLLRMYVPQGYDFEMYNLFQAV